jgi:hypothetical protein
LTSMKRLTELTGESWRDYLMRAEVPMVPEG